MWRGEKRLILISGWPFHAGFHHVAGHQLQPLLQVFGELRLGPVQVQDEHLERVQLPEQVLRGGRAVTGGQVERSEVTQTVHHTFFITPPGLKSSSSEIRNKRAVASEQTLRCELHNMDLEALRNIWIITTNKNYTWRENSKFISFCCWEKTIKWKQLKVFPQKIWTEF